MAVCEDVIKAAPKRQRGAYLLFAIVRRKKKKKNKK